MNIEEFKALKKIAPSVSIDELPVNCGKLYSGSLLFGYTENNDLFHVYAKDDMIHAVTYTRDGDIITHVKGETMKVYHLTNKKVIVGDNAHYFFARLLRSRNEGFTVLAPEGKEPIKENEFLKFALIA